MPADVPAPDLVATMFEDGNRVRFQKPVDMDGRAWWLRRFWEPHALTPEGMGMLLTKSAQGDKNVVYEFIDGVAEAFRVRVSGQTAGPGEVWFVERTFELKANLFNADEMFLPAVGRRGGLGRRLMGDLIEAAHSVGAERIKVQARDIGRYVWLRMGFRPDAGSWRDMRKTIVSELVRHQESLGEATMLQVMKLAVNGGPEVAAAIACLEHPVPSRPLFDAFGERRKVHSGKALFLEAVGEWDGEFDLADAEMNRIAQDYLARGRS